jgi:hypothetical protein
MLPGKQDFYLTYGRIILKIHPARNPEAKVREFLALLYFAGNEYNIKYLSESPSSGIPMSFECLEW